jgi:hyaluronan synthase
MNWKNKNDNSLAATNQGLSWLGLYFLVFSIILVKFITLKEYSGDIWFSIYSVAVSFYILIRFGLSYLYRPVEDKFDHSYQPTVTFAVPAKNEEDNILESIFRLAETDYPKDKFNIIVVNDGSTDNTLSEMEKAQKIAAILGVEVQIIDWKVNRGKREGMAECVKRTNNEVIVFVDSDSFVEKNTLKELVKYFTLDGIGAVTAHTHV